MKRSLSGWLALASALLGLGAQAQTPAAAPAANPANSAAKPSAEAHAPAPTGGAGRLPAGHPPSASPHGAAAGQDSSSAAADLPAGSVETLIIDGNENPVANTQVRLNIVFSKISEGESRSERFAKTDENGRVRFDALKVGSDFSYRVSVANGPANFISPQFMLSEATGHRVRLHLLPYTKDINSALVGMRGFVVLEPRDDVFQFQIVYYLFNVGSNAWVPEDVVLRLPTGYKAFRAQDAMGDAGFEEVEGQGARLKGTFPPGQHNIAFRFQLPKSAEPSISFRIQALPHVAELRVIAEASKKMSLQVSGFEEIRPDSMEGKRVLVTRKVMKRGEDPLEYADITLSGLPVPGAGRWYAALVAAGLAGLGFAAARGKLRLDSEGEDKQSRDVANAREILLNELVEVERARQSGDLGPRAYGDARRTLLDALTRLGSDALGGARAGKKKKAAVAS